MRSASRSSPWLRRFLPLIPSGGQVLDLACGSGRNSRLLSAAGFPVLGVDLDPGDGLAGAENPGIELMQADLEKDPWPLEGRTFAAVVVCNYLWRPLFPKIFAAVSAGGVLIYETFAEGNADYGRPRSPDYLLEAGELLERLPADWQVVAYEHGLVEGEQVSVRQRLAARRPPLRGPASLGRAISSG